MRLGKGGDKSPVRRRKIARFIAALVLIGLFFAGWQHYSNSPSEGVVVKPITDSSKQADTAENSVKGHFRGTYVAFDYPNYYTDTQTIAPLNQIVEQFSFGARFGPADSRRISVTVKSNSTPMKEDSAYVFRTQTPSSYALESVMINNRQVDKLTRDDSGEVTYFIPGDGYYAVVVATSTRAGGEFSADVSLVATSFSWLK